MRARTDADPSAPHAAEAGTGDGAQNAAAVEPPAASTEATDGQRAKGGWVTGGALWALEQKASARSRIEARRETPAAAWKRWLWRGVIVAAAAAAGVALTAWATAQSPEQPPGEIVVLAGSMLGSGSAVSAMLIGKLRHALGILTSAALVSTLWGLVLGALAWTQSACPTGAGMGRCDGAETATFVAIGMLFVLTVTALLYPPYAFVKAAQGTRRLKRRASAWADRKLAQRKASRTPVEHRGRVTVNRTKASGKADDISSGGTGGRTKRRGRQR